MSLVLFLHIKRQSADFEKMAEGNPLSGTETAEVIFRERSDGGRRGRGYERECPGKERGRCDVTPLLHSSCGLPKRCQQGERLGQRKRTAPGAERGGRGVAATAALLRLDLERAERAQGTKHTDIKGYAVGPLPSFSPRSPQVPPPEVAAVGNGSGRPVLSCLPSCWAPNLQPI